MKKLAAFCLGMGLLILSCAGAYLQTATDELNDKKFISAGSPLGLTSEKTLDLFGKPRKIVEEGCGLPIPKGEGSEVLKGDAWFYMYQEENSARRLSICVYKNHNISFMDEFMIIAEGIFTTGKIETTNANLIKELMENDKIKGNDDPQELLKSADTFI